MLYLFILLNAGLSKKNVNTIHADIFVWLFNIIISVSLSLEQYLWYAINFLNEGINVCILYYFLLHFFCSVYIQRMPFIVILELVNLCSILIFLLYLLLFQ